jgi:hypothetical protein
MGVIEQGDAEARTCAFFFILDSTIWLLPLVYLGPFSKVSGLA